MSVHSDGVQVRHSNPITAAGFTMIPNVVLCDPTLSVGAKITYGYLKHLAWRERSDTATPPLAAICHDLAISENTARTYVGELRDAGLVETHRRGLGLPNVYVVHDPQISRSGNAESASQTLDISVSSRARDPRLGSKDVEAKTKTPPIAPPTATPVPINRPSTVARKRVTDPEYAQAVQILEEFNNQAGTRYTSSDWIAKIVSRIREHPELPVDAHRIVISRVLAEPWWSGDASPSVIYGNAALFEKSVHAVRTEPKERSLSPDEIERLG